ncbi:MAG: L-aspartate oxidase [Chromatiales bacterium]|nr:L-aspartate oxidase [Chromatiales bacterium]
MQPHYDVLILGSGAAGLSVALGIDPAARVGVISKGDLADGNTLYAQGGISAVLDNADSIDAHVRDTLIAGAGLCDEAVVRGVVAESRASVEWLLEQGVVFTPDTSGESSFGYHLTREGGHSHRRVIHAADATGRAVETTLIGQARARANIDLVEGHIAIDLITDRRLGGDGRRCLGAYLLERATRTVHTVSARHVVLATGGAGKVYLYTSNPDVSTGDGIAMAWRAGCRIANMEFVQFHPTCLYHPRAKTFLITEAMRGEGAVLTLPGGERFMPRFDAREELAPRDIVARAIDHEMKRLGLDCVYLDISHRPTGFVREHFPTIHAQLLDYGIDITREPIPVVPAAHYCCGGVMADDRGRCDLDHLYAAGETAYTGLHGANRMASNSLLECLVYGKRVAADINAALEPGAPAPALPAWDETLVTDSDEEVVVSHNWDELRRFMWDYVGIVRSSKRLERAKRRVDLLRHEIAEYYGHFRVTNDLLELRNLVEVADLIIRSALRREESRGLHYTRDFPLPNDAEPPRSTVLRPSGFVAGARS